MAATFPSTDEGLLAWSVNFSTKITATPTAFGLTSTQATAYTAVHTAYATALAACDPTLRNKTATATKNTAKAALKLAARQTGSIVEGTPTVTDAQKISLGLSVRRTPVPIPAPSSVPALEVASVTGWTVSIHLHDTSSSAKRGKPPGVLGAAVFSFVGATPPAGIGEWQFEGNTGRAKSDVVFDNSAAPGTKVWLTAFWFNGRKESGPACAPVSTNLQGGGVTVAA